MPNILCKLNLHAWVPDPETKCGQKCKRCSATRDVHQMGKSEFRASAGCVPVKACQRCDYLVKEKNPRHDWDEWTYFSEKDCRYVRVCRRCGEAEYSKEKHHHWNGAFEYYRDHECTKSRECTRCAYIEYSSTAYHEYDDPVYVRDGSCDTICTCQRCGAGLSGEKHVWGRLEYEEDDSCVKVQFCLRCGDQKRQSLSDVRHNYKVSAQDPAILVCPRCGDEKANPDFRWEPPSE